MQCDDIIGSGGYNAILKKGPVDDVCWDIRKGLKCELCYEQIYASSDITFLCHAYTYIGNIS